MGGSQEGVQGDPEFVEGRGQLLEGLLLADGAAALAAAAAG